MLGIKVVGGMILEDGADDDGTSDDAIVGLCDIVIGLLPLLLSLLPKKNMNLYIKMAVFTDLQLPL